MMKGHRRWPARTWILLPTAVVLGVGHIVLPYLLAHAALSATVVSGVIVVIVVTHLGLLGALLDSLRSHGRRP
jgi:VIT1/CCC1 family predicted Fe2+/Mn2+ transporter